MSSSSNERALWASAVVLVAIAAIFVDRYLSPQPISSHPQGIDGHKVTWLSEHEITKSSKDSRSDLPPYGLMRAEWQTPIYHVSYAAVRKDLTVVTSRVGQLVLQHYDALLKENAGRLVHNAWSPNGANQAFFEWQTRGGWKLLAETPEVKALLKWFHFASDTYLSAIGQTREQIMARKREIHAWATVNRDCMGHMSHTHPHHMVSGVFYVTVPDTAGPIIFRDPRGPLPPFDGTITIHPRVGDLIIFPSWLTHEVVATPSSEARISIAFNMPGEWADTASVAAQFPLERD